MIGLGALAVGNTFNSLTDSHLIALERTVAVAANMVGNSFNSLTDSHVFL